MVTWQGWVWWRERARQILRPSSTTGTSPPPRWPQRTPSRASSRPPPSLPRPASSRRCRRPRSRRSPVSLPAPNLGQNRATPDMIPKSPPCASPTALRVLRQQPQVQDTLHSHGTVIAIAAAMVAQAIPFGSDPFPLRVTVSAGTSPHPKKKIFLNPARLITIIWCGIYSDEYGFALRSCVQRYYLRPECWIERKRITVHSDNVHAQRAARRARRRAASAAWADSCTRCATWPRASSTTPPKKSPSSSAPSTRQVSFAHLFSSSVYLIEVGRLHKRSTGQSISRSRVHTHHACASHCRC